MIETTTMLILNFAHPLTETQLEQIKGLTNQAIERVIEINSQIDAQQPLVAQVMTKVQSAKLHSSAHCH